MAKELPYFRFTSQEWQNGDISLESYELKGIFMDICAFYWIKDCSITLAMLEKRFRSDKELLNELLELEIIKIDNDSDFLHINFLDEQFDMLSEQRKRRQKAGSKGGKKKSSNAKAKLKQSSSYKDKDKDNNKDKDKNKNIPSFDDFKKYAFSKAEELNIQIDMLKLQSKYESWKENGWKDGYNKKIVNWKSKLNNTLQYLKSDNQEKNIHGTGRRMVY